MQLIFFSFDLFMANYSIVSFWYGIQSKTDWKNDCVVCGWPNPMWIKEILYLSHTNSIDYDFVYANKSFIRWLACLSLNCPPTETRLLWLLCLCVVTFAEMHVSLSKRWNIVKHMNVCGQYAIHVSISILVEIDWVTGEYYLSSSNHSVWSVVWLI